MQYHFKRALGMSFLLYVTTFVVGIVAGEVSGQDMSSMETIGDSFWYVGMVSAVILMTVFALWYFKDKKIAASLKSGLLFGLTAFVLGFVLDLIFFSLGNLEGANVDLTAYYGDFRFWIIALLVVVTAGAVGAYRQRMK